MESYNYKNRVLNFDKETIAIQRLSDGLTLLHITSENLKHLDYTRYNLNIIIPEDGINIENNIDYDGIKIDASLNRSTISYDFPIDDKVINHDCYVHPNSTKYLDGLEFNCNILEFTLEEYENLNFERFTTKSKNISVSYCTIGNFKNIKSETKNITLFDVYVFDVSDLPNTVESLSAQSCNFNEKYLRVLLKSNKKTRFILSKCNFTTEDIDRIRKEYE